MSWSAAKIHRLKAGAMTSNLSVEGQLQWSPGGGIRPLPEG